MLLPNQTGIRLACWQVIDTRTGATLWTTGDTLSLFNVDRVEPEDAGPGKFRHPALSPDGRFLVVYALIGIRQWAIIDLDNNQAPVYGGNDLPDVVRWGPIPDQQITK